MKSEEKKYPSSSKYVSCHKACQEYYVKSKSIQDVGYMADIFFKEVDISIVGYFDGRVSKEFTDNFDIDAF